MRIAMIVAGAGSMYCGACARDSDLARGLRAIGHDIAIFPIYTPLRLEEDLEVRQEPLQIGGINAFLREKSPRLSHLLKPFHRWLDSPALITWASQFAVRTQASDLGQMTASFLSGAKGAHSAEIQALANSVAEFHPEVVILANSLLAGLIEQLKNTTGAVIVCQVQGEDGFLDELPEPWHGRSMALLQDRVKDAEGFIAPCADHAEQMSIRLNQDLAKFFLVPPGVASASAHAKPSTTVTHIGHLSSIRRAKGLDVLVSALAQLHDVPLKVSVRGKVLEPAFYQELVQMVGDAKVNVEFGGEISPHEKRAFLGGCDFLVLPSRLHESRAIVALEALACGTPVIAPATGIFPELAKNTGGVALYSGSDSLSKTIRRCVADKLEWRERGESAALAIAEQYSIAQSAKAAERCLKDILEKERLSRCGYTKSTQALEQG